MARNFIDLTGMIFGQWTVVSDTGEITKDRDRYWNCICSCGTERKVRGSSLRKGKSQSCGCLKSKKISQRMTKNLLGQRFGKLVVIEEAPHQNGHAMWKCKCDCGNQCIRSSANLLRNDTQNKSCGCYGLDFITNLNKKDLTGQKFGKLLVLQSTEKRSTGGSIIWKCKCDCGNNIEVPTNSLTTGNTTSCDCINYSIGEKNIENILKQNNILFKSQYITSELKLKKFDFAILKEEKPIRLIEFDGQQHYMDRKGLWNSTESLETIQARDQQKNQWAKNHNIPLVRIPYWERDNITLDLILGDKYLVK